MTETPTGVSREKIQNSLGLKESSTAEKGRMESIRQLINHLNVVKMLMDSLYEDYIDNSWQYNFAYILKSKIKISEKDSLENYELIEKIRYLKKMIRQNFFLDENPNSVNSNKHFADAFIKIKETIAFLEMLEDVELYLNDFITNLAIINLTYIQNLKSMLVEFKSFFDRDTLIKNLGARKKQKTSSTSSLSMDSSISSINNRDGYSLFLKPQDDSPSSYFKRDDDTMLFGIKMNKKVPPSDIECEEPNEKKVPEKSSKTYEWNLTDQDVPNAKQKRWNMTDAEMNSDVLRRWNLTSTDVNLPDFVFKVIHELLTSLNGLMFESGQLNGDVIKENILKTKVEFLKLVNIIYNSIPFLKGLNLNLAIESPRLFPDLLIYLRDFFNAIRDLYCGYGSTLAKVMSDFGIWKKFFEQYWHLDEEIEYNKIYRIQKDVVLKFLNFAVVFLMNELGPNQLMYSRDSSIRSMLNDMYINFGNLKTSNMLNTNEEFGSFTSAFGRLYVLSNGSENQVKQIEHRQYIEEFVLN